MTADKRQRTQDQNTADTQDLTWKTPPMRREKTTGASQQTLLTIIKSWVITPCSGLQDRVFRGTLI